MEPRTHHEAAKRSLIQAKATSLTPVATHYASIGTLEALLALLDYLQEHDGDEPVFDPTSPQVIVLQNRIRHLEEDLEGARAALRARDAEITIETNQGNEQE